MFAFTASHAAQYLLSKALISTHNTLNNSLTMMHLYTT